MNNKRGRPTKLNSDVLESLVAMFERGAGRKMACEAVDISYMTFLNWLHRGEKAKSGEYFDFFCAIKKAEGLAKVFHVANIHRHAVTTWQASAWWLERKCPEEFRKVDRIESTGIDGQPQQVEHVITWKTKPVINSEALSPPMNGGSRMNGNGLSSTVKPSEK